jgi:hypothetical protein
MAGPWFDFYPNVYCYQCQQWVNHEDSLVVDPTWEPAHICKVCHMVQRLEGESVA